MYKIEAVIHKPGNAPAHWVRYSDKPLTLKQCRDLITPPKTPAKFTMSMPISKITGFKCIQVD
ncbi:TPA: DUF1187 family protein [Enterobacter hormaechei]|nr:DUF1187 family protein [Enterobacter hormaechei]